MHIALYVRAWPLGLVANGIVTYVHCMRSALQAQGHRVSVFAELVGPGDHGQDVHQVTRSLRHRMYSRVNRLLGRGVEEVFSWGDAIADAIAAVHRRTPIDVVEMEEGFGWCADVQRALDCPVVVKLHGPAFLTEAGPAASLPLTITRVAREGRALLAVAAVLSPSRATLDAVVRRYDLPPAHCEHLPNPLLIEPDTPLWSIDRCERRTILFVGKFDWIKGGDVMVRAFARLLDRVPDATLLFVGSDDGIAGEAGARMQLAEYVQDELGPARAASLRFLGRLDAAAIQGLRVRAAMTVVASRWENQAYTALEAMAQGCPTIGTDTGGMSEIIGNGANGLLCRVDDPRDLCRAMSELLHDDALCVRLGRNARAHVLATHAPDLLARRTVAAYERVIAQHALRRHQSSKR